MLSAAQPTEYNMLDHKISRRSFNKLIPVIFAVGIAPKLEANASPIRSCLKNPTIVQCISFLVIDSIVKKAVDMNESYSDIIEGLKSKDCDVFNDLTLWRQNRIGLIAWTSIDKKTYATSLDFLTGITNDKNYIKNWTKASNNNNKICFEVEKYIRNCDNIFYHQLNDYEREHLTTILKDYYAKAHLERVFPEYPRGSQVAVA